MKHILLLLCAVVGISLTSCAQEKKQKQEKKEQKVLVAYFSATGTTKAVAEKIAAATGGTLSAIQPEQPYTAADLDWRNEKSRSTIEMENEKSRPACKKISTEGYDIVYIGYPIWWNKAPRVVNSFIESHDLSGKRIIPFATSGGSGIENSVDELKKAYPSLLWQNGKLLNSPSQKEIETWVNQQ